MERHQFEYDEDFQFSLPRSESGQGDDLIIEEVRPNGAVVITDRERAAVYVPNGEPLKGEQIRIVPNYVEAGWFSEANCVLLTDGNREVLYVPKAKAD